MTVLTEKDVADLCARARTEINNASDLEALELCRRTYLGRKSELYQQLQILGTLEAPLRRERGAYLNRTRATLEECVQSRKAELVDAPQTDSDVADLGLPSRARYVGGLHPLTMTMLRIRRIFQGAGFELAEGPEVEDEYHNFDALNVYADHPARTMHDTMYLAQKQRDNRLLLRSHTSPVQIRTMREQPPPLRIICPGRAYRCDMDLTHTPMFHQVEGLWIDKHISFADLRGVVTEFLQLFFGYEESLSVRFRASYFPFTEPSAEVDIGCVRCHGQGCKVCGRSGWLEVMGCGMVHPNVLAEAGLDADEWNGMAFGLGVERLAMLYYDIDDLRLFFDNDPRFLSQFWGRTS